MAEEYLPEEVIYRKKEGFGFPVKVWIDNFKELYFDDLLENGFLIKNNLISAKFLKSIRLKTSLNTRMSWYYWQVIILEIWFQLFIENKEYDEIFEV